MLFLSLSPRSHSLLLQVKLYYAPVGQSDIIVLDPDIDTIMELDGNIKYNCSQFPFLLIVQD